MAYEKDSTYTSIESDITELKVGQATITERLKAMSDKQDSSQETLHAILDKVDNHGISIEKFKNDRSTIVWIFGILYAGALAWVEYRSRT